MKTVVRASGMVLALCTILVLSAGAVCDAAAGGRLFELGLGGGINLNGVNSTQFLISPAVFIPLAGSRVFRLGVEGDIEFIEHEGRVTVITGIAPLIRAIAPSGTVWPFIEIGGGVNYASRKRIDGKELDGPFLFSAMAGAGIEMTAGKRLLRASYRLRHLSNGSLYDKNEGLNTQYLFLSISF